MGVDIHTVQLYGEETIRTTWPWIYPHSHLSLVEWLGVAADKGPQEVHAHQPTS
jgi:hypothetical protein